ncbi:MAG: cysteine desulfurase [Azoarcus sp.]|jgi:cysteine desulfurase|nr:cysteine desulfurase [Azoarcus sp.]
MPAEPVYLDWNATTPLHPAVREAMLPWVGEYFGNASSLHRLGRRAKTAIEEARSRVAAAVGAHPAEVIFTSGGSEANNLFIKGVTAPQKPGIFAASAIEHPCVLEPMRQLARQGWALVEISVDGAGVINPSHWREVMEKRPALVSIMAANNETGTVQDIANLASGARSAGAWFHCDAVQAFGKIPLNFRSLGVSALTLSAHKIGGPLGAGALVLDKRMELSALIAGGGQERGLRSGTENVAAIVGFGVAAELAVARMAEEGARLLALRETIETRLTAMGATVFGYGACRLPNTAYFAFDGIDGDTLAGQLDYAGFACGSGSACSSTHAGPSHVLRAMGVSPEWARGALRVSMGLRTTEDDIKAFLAAVGNISSKLKNLSAISA